VQRVGKNRRELFALGRLHRRDARVVRGAESGLARRVIGPQRGEREKGEQAEVQEWVFHGGGERRGVIRRLFRRAPFVIRHFMKSLLTFLALAMLTASSLAADGPIRHVVHFKFKADATKEQIAKIVQEFAALKTKIRAVESLEWGTDVSPEGLGQGYTHCWIITFNNAADRDTYLKHDDHTAFVAILKPILDSALVVDFVPQK
jgi:hypothetical protein